MDLDSYCLLDDSLNLLLYFANRMTSQAFVFERYSSDVLRLASRVAEKFSCGIASRLDALVVAANTTGQRTDQTTIALNIRRPDGHRFVAVREGCGMRMIIGDDRTVNERMSGREDYDTLLPLLNRGSLEFAQLQLASYSTLFSRVEGYSDLEKFLQDVREDNGIDGEEEAQHFGYESFADFLRSAEMNAKVRFTADSSGRTVCEAVPSVENIHLRWEQQKSFVSVAERSAKKARNEASDARGKVLELERLRLREVPDLVRRLRELELQLHQKNVALADAERKIECFCCKDRSIEVVFNCGHGACRICTEQLTTEERPAPGTNRFSVNGPKIRVRPFMLFDLNLSCIFDDVVEVEHDSTCSRICRCCRRA